MAPAQEHLAFQRINCCNPMFFLTKSPSVPLETSTSNFDKCQLKMTWRGHETVKLLKSKHVTSCNHVELYLKRLVPSFVSMCLFGSTGFWFNIPRAQDFSSPDNQVVGWLHAVENFNWLCLMTSTGKTRSIWIHKQSHVTSECNVYIYLVKL